MLHFKGWHTNVIAETPYYIIRRDFERRDMIARLRVARRLCDKLRIDIRPVYPRTILSDVIILFWNREEVS